MNDLKKVEISEENKNFIVKDKIIYGKSDSSNECFSITQI